EWINRHFNLSSAALFTYTKVIKSTYENLNKFVEYIRVIQVKDDNNVNIGVTGALGWEMSTKRFKSINV
ncbi:hypothetical protein LCGC14_2619790, partial [marine sediment metagenome]